MILFKNFPCDGPRYTYNTNSIISKQEALTFVIAINLKKASRVLVDPKLNLRELNKFIKIQAEGISRPNQKDIIILLFLTLARPQQEVGTIRRSLTKKKRKESE